MFPQIHITRLISGRFTYIRAPRETCRSIFYNTVKFMLELICVFYIEKKMLYRIITHFIS